MKILLSFLPLFILLTSCTATPKVKYISNVTEDYKGLIKFKIAKSVILIKRDKENEDSIVLTAVPVENDNEVFAIQPSDGLGVTTHLKITKRSNTELIQSIGTEIEDRRVEIIQQIGAAAVGIAGIALKEEPKEPIDSLPIAIDVKEIFLDSPNRDYIPKKELTLENGWKINASFDKVSADAILISDYIESTRDRDVSVLFYSACRSMDIEFVDDLNSGYKGQSFNFKIADPNFVQTIGLPAKGNIDMHTSCGVDVKSEKADVATNSEIINTLITQAKSLIDTIKKNDSETVEGGGEGASDSGS